jgi:hypothetical protein
MDSITEQFIKSDMFRKLRHRASTMAKAIEHLERWSVEQPYDPPTIIETGTARIEGNWHGDGQSTLVWDWFAQNNSAAVLSIDLVQESVDIAKRQVTHVECVQGDSIQTLNKWASEMPGLIASTRLLYLDSFDWSPELQLESAGHHLCELTTVWAKLPSGCLIMVDDRHSPTQGKHVMVDGFMRALGVKPLFAEYQIGWIKPYYL